MFYKILDRSATPNVYRAMESARFTGSGSLPGLAVDIYSEAPLMLGRDYSCVPKDMSVGGAFCRAEVDYDSLKNR